MTKMEDLLPDYILERSFGFKTLVVIVGAVSLLISTLLRSEYPYLWIIPFLAGALVEWLIVATVYVEMNQIEETAVQARNDIEEALSEIERVQSEIQDTQAEIDEAKENIFSFISDSQGVGATDSLEDRLSEVESELGLDRAIAGSDNLPSRVSELERKIERIERDQNRRW